MVRVDEPSPSDPSRVQLRELSATVPHSPPEMGYPEGSGHLTCGEHRPCEKFMESYGVPELIQEPRLVVVVCVGYREDWVKGAITGHDYWSQAEDFIAKRKSREIDPLEYYIPEIDEADDDGEDDSEDE
ncbi:hypothetical protein B0H14DRAFT_2608603 [Mycena olivaceomarginata]|nr:hypothetical protein B0H14DRAFT_2608603 [Mycena olivaceomarginata]